MISLACADIPIKAYWNVFDCLRTGRIGRGKYVDRFEDMAREYFGVKHCLAVSSGTMADTIMLMTLKELVPDKNEVILPAFTFVAHANSVLLAGLKPIFIDEGDDVMEYSGPSTLCYFPVHLLGLFGISKFNDLPMIEDCCEAMGGEFQGKKFGTFGLAGAFSMYPSHTITTGEGGLIITNDDSFYEIAKSIHNHGKWNTQDFDFKYAGLNAKMTNLQAAIGCALIGSVNKINKKRRENVWLYNLLFDKNFYSTCPHCYPVFYPTQEARDKALLLLRLNGIEARKLMGCVPDYEPYRKRFGTFAEGSLIKARQYASTGLFLPVHQQLTDQNIRRICDVINESRQS